MLTLKGTSITGGDDIVIDAASAINNIDSLDITEALKQMIETKEAQLKEALETGDNYLQHAPDGVKKYFETVPHEQAMQLKKMFKYSSGEITAYINGKIFTFVYVDYATGIQHIQQEEGYVKEYEHELYFRKEAADTYVEVEAGSKRPDIHMPDDKLLKELIEAMPAGDYDTRRKDSVAAAQLFGMLWGKLSGERDRDRTRDMNEVGKLWIGGSAQSPGYGLTLQSNGEKGEIGSAYKGQQFPFIMLKDKKYMQMS